MEKKVAVYAGSFDPLTVGHLWVIERGAGLFDKLIVAVGINPEKQKDYMFSVEERLEMIRKSTKKFSNVEVGSYKNMFLIHYAQSVSAKFILRGIRKIEDYEEEREWRNINGDLDSTITTYFVMPPREINEVSSSMVKGLIGPEGWERIVRKYVTKPVFEKLKEVHRARST